MIDFSINNRVLNTTGVDKVDKLLMIRLRAATLSFTLFSDRQAANAVLLRLVFINQNVLYYSIFGLQKKCRTRSCFFCLFRWLRNSFHPRHQSLVPPDDYLA